MYSKHLAILLLSLQLSFVLAQGTGPIEIKKVLATYTPAERGQPVLLKINNWYLLASYPFSPYKTEQGAIMVPLQALGQLFGGEVKLDPERRSGEVRIRPVPLKARKLRVLRVTADSPTLDFDDRKIPVNPRPQWLEPSQELLVPLDSLLDPLDITLISQKDGIVKLESEIVRRRAEFSCPPPVRFPLGYRDTERLIPRDVTVRHAVEEVSNWKFFDIALLLEQQAGPPVRIGTQALFTYVKYRNGDVDIGGRDTSLVIRMGPLDVDPCIEHAYGLFCRTYYFSETPREINYVLARVTVRK